MCLAILSYKQNFDYPLVVVNNRDEYHDRATKPCHFWQDYPNILGGRDIKAGGSWFAVNRNGSFALVTNYRDPHLQKPRFPLSRGNIVKDFLISSEPDKFLDRLKDNCDRYKGFNLILSWDLKLFYFSNISHRSIQLKPGLYGASNHLLDTPWPKLKLAKKQFKNLLDSQKMPLPPKQIIELMHDDRTFSDPELPKTGIDLKLEQFLSPIFIIGNEYGTRSTSVLQISRSGRIDFYEQNYLSNGSKSDFFHYYIK